MCVCVCVCVCIILTKYGTRGTLSCHFTDEGTAAREEGVGGWEEGRGGRKDQRPLSVIADYKTPMSTRRPSEQQLLAHLAEKGRNGDSS